VVHDPERLPIPPSSSSQALLAAEEAYLMEEEEVTRWAGVGHSNLAAAEVLMYLEVVVVLRNRHC
jgi:hypothetical protein